jgi:steroid delta-isomerase-like uncharacterized protein
MEEAMKTVSTADANIALVQNLYAAFFRGDMPAILAAMSPDIDWQSVGPADEFQFFAARKGAAGVGQFFQDLTASFEFTEFSPREFVASGDTVVCLGHYAMTFKKSGRKAAADWAMAFTFRDGKVSKFREHTDSAALLAAYRVNGAASTDRGSSAVEARRATIRHWIEDGWNKQNLAIIDEVFAADVVQHDSTNPPVKGREQLKGYIGMFMTAFPDLRFTTETLAAEGDSVIWRFTARGTHKAPLMDIPASGKVGTVGGMVEFRFSGREVAEIWLNLDRFGLLQQIGVIPA